MRQSQVPIPDDGKKYYWKDAADLLVVLIVNQNYLAPDGGTFTKGKYRLLLL